MQTLDSMPEYKQIRTASETLYVYVVLLRIGMYNIKTELEDLSLKYTDFKSFDYISKKLIKVKLTKVFTYQNFLT